MEFFSSFPAVDVVAYRPDGRLVLLAEAKSRRGTSDAWAAKLRRNILAHGKLPKSEFFLIATPDRIYGWRGESLTANEVLPQFSVDGKRALQPYFNHLKQDPDEISPTGFELVVLRWLTDIAHSKPNASERDPSLNSLFEAGLVASLNDAQIELNSKR